MGKAIGYMQNHWEALTLFLKVPGAPLDNNLCEQVLKRAILHRKSFVNYYNIKVCEIRESSDCLIECLDGKVMSKK